MTQLSKLVLLVLVGVLAKKLNIIPKQGTAVLSKLLIYITLPILTFFSITSYRLPSNILSDGLYIIGFAIVLHLLSVTAGRFLARKFKLPEVKKNVYSAQIMIGNTVYLAFPLMTAFYGETGLIYAIVYYLVSLTFIWTLGVYLFNKHQIKHIGQVLRSLINPCTISFLLGVTALLLRIDVWMDMMPWFAATYDFLYDTLYPLGSTTMSISMFFIGLIIGQMKLRDIMKIFYDKSMVVLVVTKMILLPLVVGGLAYLTKNFASSIAFGVVLIETLMPASTITVAIASENGSDYQYAMEIAIATTVVSALTIPLMLGVFEMIYLL